MDLADLLKIEPNDCLETSVGNICIFSLSLGDQREIRKALERPLEESDPNDYLKELIKHVCYPREQLKEGKYRPDGAGLSAQDVESLSHDELEKIAELYVNENPYLFREERSKKTQNEDGKQVLSFELGEVQTPKEANESYIEYLHRLATIEDRKLSESATKILSSIPDVSSFSNSIGDQLKNTFSIGESLRTSMDAIRNFDRLSLHESPPKVPSFDSGEFFHEQEERRLKPFNELSDRLDALIDTSTQSAEFMIEANKLQTEIAEEIKKSGDTTSKQASHNINLTYVVIFLTFISTVSSALSIWMNFYSDDEYTTKMAASVDEALVHLQSIDKQSEAQAVSEKILIERLEAQGEKIQDLQSINRSQGIVIQRLEDTIDELDHKLNKMPNQ